MERSCNLRRREFIQHKQSKYVIRTITHRFKTTIKEPWWLGKHYENLLLEDFIIEK